MSGRFCLLLAALLAFAVIGVGCGSDNKKSDKSAAPAAAQTDTAADTTAAATVTITEPVLKEFIDAVNQDPSILCDPTNSTAEFIDAAGGAAACKTAAKGSPAGDPYTIENITIDGDTATAIIKDATSTNTVTFVTEGDQIKVSSSETS
jgi:hypothetical protein